LGKGNIHLLFSTSCYILNPKKTPNLAKVLGQRSKTDKIDARTIYCFKDLISKEQIKVPQIDETLEKIYAYFSGSSALPNMYSIGKCVS